MHIKIYEKFVKIITTKILASSMTRWESKAWCKPAETGLELLENRFETGKEPIWDRLEPLLLVANGPGEGGRCGDIPLLGQLAALLYRVKCRDREHGAVDCWSSILDNHRDISSLITIGISPPCTTKR